MSVSYNLHNYMALSQIYIMVHHASSHVQTFHVWYYANTVSWTVAICANDEASNN